MGKEDVIVTDYLEKCRNVWMLADKTVQARTEAFDLYFNKYEGELTLESFEGFISWLKQRKNTVQTIVARGGIVRQLIKYCAGRGLCDDFSGDIKLPTIFQGQVKVVPIEEAERAIILGCQIGKTDNKLIQKHKKEALIALKFDLRTGLRVSELLGLTPDDILLEEGIFWVDTTKSHKRVAMPLPADMIDEIKLRMKQKHIFEGINPAVLNGILHRGSKKANLSFRLHVHMLRAIFCTTQLKNKQPMQTVKDLMRHADYSSLGKYSFAQMDEKKAALNTSPIILNGLQPEQLIKFVEDAILATGINKDKRLETNFIKGKRSLTFKASW